MGLAGPGVRGRGAVALQHRAGLPAGQAHQVGLPAAFGQPLVRGGVAQLVGVQAGQTSLLAAAPQHLHQAPSGQPALQPQPQPGQRGILVTRPGAKVAVQGGAGLVAKRQRARGGPCRAPAARPGPGRRGRA
jgi:hypothetical protein